MRAAALILIAAAATAGGEEPRATVVASKTEVRVGEAFTVDVALTGPPGTVYTFPKDAGSETLELQEPERLDPHAPPAPGAHRYTAAAFAVGDAEVPALEIAYRLADGTEGKVKTDAVPLRIVSVLSKDPKEQKLADIRPPVLLRVATVATLFWVGVAALVVLLGLLLFWRLRRRKPALAAPAIPPVAPDAEALQALDELRARGLLAAADYRGFYIALSEIAKRYLERRLSAPILEMTSAETWAFLRDHASASGFAASVRDLAGAADRIKFARGEGLAEEAERHASGVRQLVADLEQKLRPPSQERVA